MSRARPAPIARRSAISCRRAVARASRTPATLAHAMINTIDTIAMSSVTNATIGPPFPGTGEDASSRKPVWRFCSWYSRSSVLADHVDLGGGLRNRDTRLQPAADQQPAGRPVRECRRPLRGDGRRHAHRHPDIQRADARAMKPLRRDAHHRERMPVERQRPADDGGIRCRSVASTSGDSGRQLDSPRAGRCRLRRTVARRPARLRAR